ANETSYSAYFSNWQEHITQSVKTPTLMIMARSQKRLDITAGGLVNINLETCMKTVKTVVSYYMFLRTMATEESN
ncbi:hypothetical protein NQ314_014086, partial [Rhamnusium bicolor]